jgi:ribosomal protein S12 methylthiotransferase
MGPEGDVIMNEKIEKKIGKNIRTLRERSGITQEALAAKLQLRGCDITRSAVAKIEVGQRHLYPDEITDELIDTMAREPKIVKYLDIPIQHCNNKILKLMNRRGDGAFLRELFGKLRAKMPDIVIRTSVITGLPGEGEEEFTELCEFLKEMKLERVGAFAFSPQEGTPAFDMDYADFSVAQERAEILEQIQSRIMDEYNASFIGKKMQVLVDGYNEEFGQFYGRTYGDSPDIDGRVWIACDEALTEGAFMTITIDGLVDGDLSGYPEEE